jgi:hypothetical protein
LPKKPKEPPWNIDIAASREDRTFKPYKITKKRKDTLKEVERISLRDY